MIGRRMANIKQVGALPEQTCGGPWCLDLSKFSGRTTSLCGLSIKT